MQVVAEAVGGTVIINCTVAVRITLSVMIVLFITKAIQSTIGTQRTIIFGITLSIKRIFIAVPVNFAIRIVWAMPIIMTGNIWPRPRRPRADFDDATLNRETRKGD